MTCKQHPLAPHGFCRDASFMNDEYTCECDYWQEPYSYIPLSLGLYLVKEMQDSEHYTLVKEGGEYVTSFTAEDLKLLEEKG